MNRIKRAALQGLDRRHDEVYVALHLARENLAKAQEMKLGGDVVARHQAEVAQRRAELAAIDSDREPLQLEEERTTTRFRANVGFAFGIAAGLGALVGLLKGLVEVLRWLAGL